MNEKTIITGKKGRASTLLVIGLAIVGFALLLHLMNVGECRKWLHYYDGRECTVLFVEHLAFAGNGEFTTIIGILTYLGIVTSIAGLLYMVAYRAVSITVTDKRVYGTAAWGKRVDLPLDKISAVATSFGHGIAVATSSGSIRFKAITNNAEVHAAISKLLMERQEKAPAASEQKPTVAVTQSNADELKKFKDLLDSGVITQEEFDAKKKQLLGL